MREEIARLEKFTDKIAAAIKNERELTINMPEIKLEIDNKTIATAALDGVLEGAETSGGKSFRAVLRQV